MVLASMTQQQEPVNLYNAQTHLQLLFLITHVIIFWQDVKPQGKDAHQLEELAHHIKEQ